MSMSQNSDSALSSDQMESQHEFPFTWTIKSNFQSCCTQETLLLRIIIQLSKVIITAGPNATTHHWDQADTVHKVCSDDSANEGVWVGDGNTSPLKLYLTNQ